MVAFLSKSDASAGFDQIVEFLNAQIKKVSDVVKLLALINGKRVVVSEDVIRHDLRLDDVDGVECLPNEEIFTELTRMGYEKQTPKLMFYKAFFFAQWKFLIHTLVQCVSANRTTWNEFSCSMASAFICLATCRKFKFSKYIYDNMNTSPALTQKVFANMRRVGKGYLGVETPLFATMLVQPQSPGVEEEVEVEVPVAPTPPYPINIVEIDVDEDITLVDDETQVDLGAGLQGRTDDVSVAKEVSDVEPTMFDDEEVTMTMAQTLIKMKSEKARLLYEQMAKSLHDEEVKQAAAREKQEKDDLEKAKVLKKHYEDKQENIDWNTIAEKIQKKQLDNIRKYQSLKREPISVAQARKNMIIYLKNMVGYKMEHFRGMTYDKESFKKLKVVEVSGSHFTQDTPTDDLKEISEEEVKKMLEIIPGFEFKVEDLQVKYPLMDWEIHSEGSRSYLKIIRVGEIT
nr:hypothetical protein [Tanacetum cinerariifolium]